MAHIPMSPPTIGYLTFTYLGEHLGWTTRPWKSVNDLIPESTSVNLYSGKNTGLPMVLCNEYMAPHLNNRANWYDIVGAWADMNRVFVNTNCYTPQGLLELKKARIMRTFGVDQCTWLPYWELAKTLKFSHPELQCSIYQRQDGAMLVAYMNNSGKPIVNGWIDLSTVSKLPKITQAVDPMTEKALAIDENRIKVYANGFWGGLIIIK